MFESKGRSSISADDDAASKHLFAQEPKHDEWTNERALYIHAYIFVCVGESIYN